MTGSAKPLNGQGPIESIIETAVAAASLVFENGLLYLGRPKPTPETRMMALGLELAVMGAEPETILRLLEILMRASADSFQGDPANRLCVEAVRLILEGEEPGRTQALLRKIAGLRSAVDAAPTPRPPIVREKDNLIVKGNVGDGTVIKTAGSIKVEGHVGAATLEAGKDITVAGCVHGKGHASLHCGGGLSAGSLERVEADVGGDVLVNHDVVHAKVSCGGNFMGLESAIVGGSVFAGGSVHAHQLGYYSCGRTDVRAGCGEAAQQSDSDGYLAILVTGDVFTGVGIRVTGSRFEVNSCMEHVEIRMEGQILRILPLPREGSGLSFGEASHV